MEEYKLTSADRVHLLKVYSGDHKALSDDYGQIEEAARVATYQLCDADGREIVKPRISRVMAIKLLGRNGWLSGISRCAFHTTAMRETLDCSGQVLFVCKFK